MTPKDKFELLVLSRMSPKYREARFSDLWEIDNVPNGLRELASGVTDPSVMGIPHRREENDRGGFNEYYLLTHWPHLDWVIKKDADSNIYELVFEMMSPIPTISNPELVRPDVWTRAGISNSFEARRDDDSGFRNYETWSFDTPFGTYKGEFVFDLLQDWRTSV